MSFDLFRSGNTRDRCVSFRRSIVMLGCAFSFFAPTLLQCDPTAPPEYSIIIDPGHGGIARRNDDKWDPVTQKYLSAYAPGMTTRSGGRTFHEHLVVLELGRRLHRYLEWTQTDEGWERFLGLLREFSNQRSFARIKLLSILTREDSWNHRYRTSNVPEANAPYRLYDYPGEDNRLRPGRISQINANKPYLVVSLHTTPAGASNPGGMAAVLTPGYDTFNMLRRIHVYNKPVSLFRNTEWYGKFLITDAGWTQYQAARADTWVYFNGFRTNRSGTAINRSKNRGIRQNLITWRYRDPLGWEQNYNPNEPGPYATTFRDFEAEGPFWDRERSDMERWRREGGVVGYGGDNHTATDELMRFVQYGVRTQVPAMRPDEAIGPIIDPYVSAYSLPTFVNAICAYLEIAHLDKARDRKLIIDHADEVARSLAVGIYSLFRGLELKAGYGPYQPRGIPIDFERYEDAPGGNYFENVVR